MRRNRARWLCVLVLVGCGSTVTGGNPDAAGDGSPADAAADAPPDGAVARCDPGEPFGTPVAVTVLNSPQRDLHATLASDLVMYLASDRGGTLDLYVSTRSSPSDPWTAPSALAGFASAATETSPALTADGLTLYYQHAAAGQANGDVYVATRANTTVGFGAGTAVAALNTASDEGDVAVTGDGAAIYMAANRGATDYDIYVAGQGGGTVGAPALVAELNTAVYDAHPTIRADGLAIYFSSMRTATGTSGLADIWMATRSTTSAAFGAPVLVPELNSAANESPTWISDDGCEIYFQSNRAGGMGAQDLWRAIKPAS